MDWPLPAFCFVVFLVVVSLVAWGVGLGFGPSRLFFLFVRCEKKFFAGGQAGPLQLFGPLALRFVSARRANEIPIKRRGYLARGVLSHTSSRGGFRIPPSEGLCWGVFSKHSAQKRSFRSLRTQSDGGLFEAFCTKEIFSKPHKSVGVSFRSTLH